MAIRAFIFLTFFALPWYVVRFSLFGLPTTLLEVITLTAFAVWALDKARTRHFPPIQTQWRAPLGLFLLASIIALFTAPQFLPALGHWRAYILEPILFALVLTDTIKTERDHTHVIYALAASLVIPVLVALYQQITGSGIPVPFWAAEATRRVTSLYGYPNALGLFAVPVLILILGRIFDATSTVIPAPYRGTGQAPAGIQTKKEKTNRFLFMFLSGSPIKSGMTIRRILLTSLFFATTAAIVFTRSKGALIALAVGLAVFFLLSTKRKLLTASVILFIAAAGFLAFKDSFSLRGIATVQGGDSISVRLTQYRETWEMLKDHPFTGAGLRGYQTAMAPYHAQKYIEVFIYPHNIFLTAWSELGILGLIAFVWIIIQFCITSYQSIKLNNRETDKLKDCAAFAAMSALLVHGLVDVPYFKNDLAVLFWILFALSTPLFTDRQQTKNMLQ
ncbi:MAG: O-antigen ligase family protein [Dehalococcoidia bacterium]